MNFIRIDDNNEARALAEQHGIAENMLTSARVRLHKAIAGDIGFVIMKRSGILLPSGRMEIVLFTLFTNFSAGHDNGFAVIGWSEIEWNDLPWVIEKILEAERMMPELMHEAEAIKKAKSKGVDGFKEL